MTDVMNITVTPLRGHGIDFGHLNTLNFKNVIMCHACLFVFQQAQSWALYFCVRNIRQKNLQVSSRHVLPKVLLHYVFDMQIKCRRCHFNVKCIQLSGI